MGDLTKNNNNPDDLAESNKADEQYEDKKYEVYIAERKSLIEAEKDSVKQFDRSILTLAAGALAISVTFIKQIAPHLEGQTLKYLLVAWIAFIGSLLSTLISFLTSQKACSKQREILENEFFPQGNKCAQKGENKNKASKVTGYLNYFSIILFIIGVIFLVGFSFSNLKQNEGGKEMAEKKTNEGFQSPNPPKLPQKPDEGGKKGFVPPPLPQLPKKQN